MIKPKLYDFSLNKYVHPNFLLLEEMSGLDEREGKDNEAFISGENEIILEVMENTFSNEEKGVFMDKMSVRWNNYYKFSET
ncbi:unnamed protein product [Medioppia subpectinata]|uniref:Uncharacterized protein n=1 Tax=Medioppia subpectinata TaxID=1979941 RepID=A0A7R9KER0_9ACAR|nr:unnamed protein product [Medioppia subpectinata]CAG2100973.1 unnamed protein product [Medioppia subpectinata]